MADIKTRRRRRLAILLTIVLLLAGGVTALVYVRQYQRQQADVAMLTQAREAYEREDYSQVVQSLHRYVDANPTDTEAAYIYARSLLRGPNATPRAVGQAMRHLGRVVALEPENDEAAHELLQLYKATQQDAETLELSEKLLAKDPTDADALASKAVALTRLKRPEDALATAQEALEANPKSQAMHLLSLQLRASLGETPAALVDHAKSLVEANPNEPMFQMVLGYAYALAGQNLEAQKWLSTAADQPIEDPQLAFTLVHVLDAARLYGDSLKVLTRAARLEHSNGLYEEMARRLFEAQRYAEVAERLKSLDPQAKETSADLLGIRAMALYQSNRREEAETIRMALASRQNEPVAEAWARVLGQVYAAERKPAPETVAVIRDTLKTVPNNPYFHAYLGDAYAGTGDGELALTSWKQAAEMRPTWAGVRALIARTLIATGREDEALEYAQAAFARDPNNVDTAVTIVRARAATLGVGDAKGASELLPLIEEIQRVSPGEPQTLLLRVQLLAQSGQKPKAIAAVEELLGQKDSLSQDYLLRLAQISDQFDLGLSNRLLETAERQAGQTPELVLTKAVKLAQQGKVAEGLKLLEAGRVSAQGTAVMDWDVNLARYLEAANDGRAAEAWMKLADAYPNNAGIQQVVLQAPSVRGEREFTAKLLDRVKGLLGEGSISYRVERARWLLEGPNAEADAAAAAAILRQVIEEAPRRLEPRLMLVQALERSGRLDVAVRELRAADQAIPGSIPILLELARVHQAQRQFPAARQFLDQVAASENATPIERRQAALLLARQGDEARAIDLLVDILRDGLGGESERLLLATLYSRSGNMKDAEGLIAELVAQPEPSAETLAFALQLYRSLDRDADVERVLGMIERAPMPESLRRRIVANHHAAGGDFGRAAELYSAAAEADPQNPDGWRDLIRFHLTARNMPAALASADKARQHIPDNEAVRAMTAHADTLRGLANDPTAQSAALMLLGDEESRRLGDQALSAIAATTGPEGAAERVRRLRQLADANRDSLPLQLAATRAHLQARQPAEAGVVAERAVRTFPTAPEPAALYAESLAEQGQWLDVLGAANDWRNRAGGDTRQPEIMLAEANLRIGRPADALRLVAPYLDEALRAPGQNVDVLSRHLRGLVAAGRGAEASKVLLPLIEQSQVWRVLAMQMATGEVKDPALAAEWLRAVGAHTPESARADRTLLAQSWFALAQSTGDANHRARTAELIDALTAQPDAPSTAWYLRGVLAEQAGQTDAAEQAYRQALQRDPNLPLAKNNLAWILVTRNSDMTEAVRLASEASAAEPRNASYLDTLALAQSKAGQCDAAVQAIDRAIQLEPSNPQWQRTKAEVLDACGRTEEAKRIRDGLPQANVGM